MPFFMEDVAKGAKAAVDARYAEPLAATNLAQEQATLTGIQQQNELRNYDLRAAAELATQPQINYDELYANANSQQEKLKVIQQKKQAAEALYKKTMASKQYSESTRKAYEDAQAEEKALQAEVQKQQAEDFRRVVDPALMATDPASWEVAKQELPKAAAAAARAQAIANGETDEKFLEFASAQAEKDARAQMPQQWGPSARAFRDKYAAQWKGIEDAQKLQENVRKEEKHKADLELNKSAIRENNAQAARAIAAAKNGEGKQDEELFKVWKESNAVVTRLRGDSVKLNGQLNTLKAKFDMAIEDETKVMLQEQIAQTTAERDAIAVQIRTAEDQAQLARDMVTSKSGTTPKEISPNETAAISAWGSYEPSKYEYRVNPATGKIQRKLKG